MFQAFSEEIRAFQLIITQLLDLLAQHPQRLKQLAAIFDEL